MPASLLYRKSYSPYLVFIVFLVVYTLQILAINRGEEKKALTVKVNIPDNVKVQFIQFTHHKFIRYFYPVKCKEILEKSIEDSFERLIQPQICRHIRSANINFY